MSDTFTSNPTSTGNQTKSERFWRWCLLHWGWVFTFNAVFILIVTLVAVCLQNWIHSRKMWDREMFDEVLAFGAIWIALWFGLVGWFGSHVVERMQGKTIEAQSRVMSEVGLLEKANEELKLNIMNMEEVIRCKVDGIPDILGRAIAIMEEAIDNVSFITFTPHFGAAHLPRFKSSKDGAVSVRKATTEILAFEAAVERFWNKLYSCVQSLPHLRVLSIPESRYYDFAVRLKERAKYIECGYSESIATEGMQKAWERLTHAATSRQDNRKAGVRLAVTDAIPYQVLIAQLTPKPHGPAERWGCMVFLVGSGNIESGQAAVGFYTELESFVNMFKVATDTSFSLDGATEVFPPSVSGARVPTPAPTSPRSARAASVPAPATHIHSPQSKTKS